MYIIHKENTITEEINAALSTLIKWTKDRRDLNNMITVSFNKNKLKCQVHQCQFWPEACSSPFLKLFNKKGWRKERYFIIIFG